MQTPTSRPRNWLRLPEAIVFHSRAVHYSEFSNFHLSEFHDGEKRFPTVEALAKFAEYCPEHAECIRKAATPGSAKALGRTMRLDATQVAAWDVMRQALRLKFTQKDELKELLLATGDKPLVERPLHRPDKFWAAGAKGDGRNTRSGCCSWSSGPLWLWRTPLRALSLRMHSPKLDPRHYAIDG